MSLLYLSSPLFLATKRNYLWCRYFRRVATTYRAHLVCYETNTFKCFFSFFFYHFINEFPKLSEGFLFMERYVTRKVRKLVWKRKTTNRLWLRNNSFFRFFTSSCYSTRSISSHGGRGIKSSHVIPQVPVAKTLAVLIAPLFALGFCIGEYYRLLLSFQVLLFLSGEFGRKFNHSSWQYW